MFIIFFYLLLILLNIVLLIAGIVIFGYGIYSFTVKGFSQWIRYSSLTLGAILLAGALYLAQIINELPL